MKEILNLALASLAAFSMLTIPYDNADAQVRRTTTTTQNRTTSGGSSTQSRSTSTQNRSTSTQSRSTSSQSRSTSQTRSSSTQSRSTSSQTRQSGSTSQTRQNTSGTTVRRSSGTSSSTQTRTGSSSGQVRQNGTSSQVRQSGSTSQTRQSGTSSQVRQSGSSTQNRQSGSSSSVRRSSGSTASGSRSSVRQNSNGGAVRQNNSSSSNRETFTARIDGVDNSVRNNPSSQSSSVVRRNSNVTRTGLSSVSGNMRQPDNRGGSKMDNSMDFRIEDHNVHRIPPRDRDFMHYDRPGHFYDHHHPHCFGFRVEVLPPRYKVVRYFGIDYYIYNDVYYRPYRDHYIVCRPPFGVTIARSVVDISFATVNFAYYSNVYRTFGAIDANNRYIDQQNRIIAQNNATIMAQNRAIAMNPNSALSSYEIANRLGLVQSYAYADRNYFYQDGVFYIVNAGGQYQVIVPPAGALVQNLPEDYDIITLGGVQYYRVDDTVYRLTLVSGSPYLEVLGQMYGQLARDYNGY